MEVIVLNDKGLMIGNVYVRDPEITDEALEKLGEWAANYTTINGQNYPGGDGDRSGFLKEVRY